VPFEADLDDEAYVAVVRRLKGEIAAGEVYQIVPSRTFSTACAEPLRAYAALRRFEPNSYRFFVQGADFACWARRRRLPCACSGPRAGTMWKCGRSRARGRAAPIRTKTTGWKASCGSTARNWPST
jgi:anthranilate synthase component 1